MKKNNTLFFILLCLVQLSWAGNFNHDYSKTWVTKMFLARPDGKGGSEVKITFEQALDIIKQTDNITLGVPKIIYLVGWQYNGHDDRYPAFFEVNRHLKRDVDESALESLRWLIREARKYNTTVSLHINMTDAYDNSPLWQEYVDNDLISKTKSGNLMVIGEYNGLKAYQINYRNEWEKGYTQRRIDKLVSLIPELTESGTIHLDAWIARPSEGHNESVVTEADFQRKAVQYWRSKGIDVTSEWYMDYMIGYVPYAWHFNGFEQQDYLRTPANVYTGAGINPDIRSSDFGLGFLFGTSSYGEPFWKLDKGYSWQENLTRDFMLKFPHYYFLNSLKRVSVSGIGNNRVAIFSKGVVVALADSTVRYNHLILRSKNTICLPALWREDKGVIIYSEKNQGIAEFDTPYIWSGIKSANLYRITAQGLIFVKKINISGIKMQIVLEKGTPYYLKP